MTRQEYWEVFKKEHLYLRWYFWKHLDDIGYKGDYTSTVKDLISDTGEEAFNKISQDNLASYTTKNLIRAKAPNVFSKWFENNRRLLSAPIADEDEWEDEDPDPLEQLIARQEYSGQPDIDEKLTEVRAFLPVKAWDIFRKRAQGVRYRELAIEYNITVQAMRAQVSRWRRMLRRRFPHRSTK